MSSGSGSFISNHFRSSRSDYCSDFFHIRSSKPGSFYRPNVLFRSPLNFIFHLLCFLTTTKPAIVHKTARFSLAQTEQSGSKLWGKRLEFMCAPITSRAGSQQNEQQFGMMRIGETGARAVCSASPVAEIAVNQLGNASELFICVLLFPFPVVRAVNDRSPRRSMPTKLLSIPLAPFSRLLLLFIYSHLIRAYQVHSPPSSFSFHVVDTQRPLVGSASVPSEQELPGSPTEYIGVGAAGRNTFPLQSKLLLDPPDLPAVLNYSQTINSDLITSFL